MGTWNWSTGLALAAFTAIGFSPASAQNADASGAIRECDDGVASSCLNAAMTLFDSEDPENPRQTLHYAGLACDGEARNGCRYYALANMRAGLMLHQRILTTAIEGDPKGVWRYTSDLNSAIDRAQAFYRTARQFDASLADDWDDKLTGLDELRQ
ncbi:hypothetical protein [Aurantiacibacter flavus]|uniref:Uncharacterized protein n=1 Tax=Aurantiacibacter flavus TaxID=3145232 RepID=A0ABV0CUQ3_9SPHN